MAEGGIQVCGNAQNCVAVCPKEIPLTTSIARPGEPPPGVLSNAGSTSKKRIVVDRSAINTVYWQPQSQLSTA